MLVVDFEGNEITFTKQDLMELTHAYCTSIHKSQGSEFPIVIMPIVRQYYRMLQRPILYTGLTRAKQSLVLLGEQEAFDIGLKTNGQIRLTQLNDLLKSYFGQNKDNLTTNKQTINEQKENNNHLDLKNEKENDIQLNESTIFQIDPMINMGEMTPYDFVER